MKYQFFLQVVVLLCILAGGALTFWYAQGNMKLQFAVGVITAVAYVIWGIMHHAKKGDLHARIVLEYILVACIAIVLLATLAL